VSNLALFQKSESLVMAQAKKFAELAKTHKAVSFEQEAHFALQALKANDYLAKVAAENPDSLISAVQNIASVGLSLNPALKHAYLVPRGGKVCLDIGYKGLVHLAIDSGGIKYVQAELFLEKDGFELRGRGEEPKHHRNPFALNRGEIMGAYAVAKTTDGDFLTETMTAQEIYAIRDRTESYKAFVAGKSKSCPWSTDEGEMMKKTVIRRASKMWPMTNTGRFEKALQIQDDIEPIDVTPLANSLSSEPEGPNPQIGEIRDILKALGKDEDKFIGYLSTVNNRKIQAIEDLSKKEIEIALIQLYSWLKAATAKEQKEKNENAK
jgi:recombination protein RecT